MKRTLDRAGFTLIELVVVIVIIGILIALLLPAVQSAREAARMASCSGKLSQMALAMLQHEQMHKFFPSGGWGYNWVGDPDRGTGKEQPGSWIYAILPFMEQTNMHDLGKDGDPDNWTPSQLAGSAQCIGTPQPATNCPSRRAAIPYAIGDSYGGPPPMPGAGPLGNPNGGVSFHGAAAVSAVARSDYAACMGDQLGSFVPGPETLSEARQMTRNNTWPDAAATATGVCYMRSQVSIRMVTDGLSKTYLIGEKHVNSDNHFDGRDPGDDLSMYSGCDNDNLRTTHFDGVTPDHTPIKDTIGLDGGANRFGSAHHGSLNMAFCNGSVQPVSYLIDAEVHRRLGNRQDGMLVDGTSL
jgi:prepilin-type N-terminal cleavage/methylation domain-containing protein